MFASKCVSGRTDASVLVLGRWSWGIIDLIQVMFLLSPYAQSLEQDGFGTAGDSQQTHRGLGSWV